jgi:hypothetical protein
MTFGFNWYFMIQKSLYMRYKFLKIKGCLIFNKNVPRPDIKKPKNVRFLKTIFYK